MAYTPINWQNGDTITAEKMNKMDNGWGVQTTQLFSETVTTEDTGEGFSTGGLTYASPINAEAINVSFDSTVYTCPRIDAGGDSAYGGFDDGPDFTTYPFFIYSAADGGDNTIATQTEGSHSVQVSASAIEVGDTFKSVVRMAGEDTFAGTDAYPLIASIGTTTFREIYSALENGRGVLVRQADSNGYFYEVVVVASFTDYTVRTIGLGLSSSQVSITTYHANSADDPIY